MKHHWVFIAIGVLVGGVCGWIYWSSIGCSSGGCIISAHPLNSTLYGSLMGGLTGSTIHGFIQKRSPNEQQL